MEQEIHFCTTPDGVRIAYAVVGEGPPLVDHLELREFALSGVSEGGPTCVSYAARHPERVSRMVLYGTFAKGAGIGGGPELMAAVKAVVKAEWGGGSGLL